MYTVKSKCKMQRGIVEVWVLGMMKYTKIKNLITYIRNEFNSYLSYTSKSWVGAVL